MATQVKKEIVAELVEKIKKAQSVVFVDYQGIKVNEETALRKKNERIRSGISSSKE